MTPTVWRACTEEESPSLLPGLRTNYGTSSGVFHQLTQMLILPIAFPLEGGNRFGRDGGITNSSGGIDGCGDGMSAHMCSCHGLSRGTCRGAGRIVLSNFAGSSMGREGRAAHIGHPEDARCYPRAYRFDSLSGTVVFGTNSLKMRQDPLSAVRRPRRQCLVAGSTRKLHDRLVQA